MSLVDQWNRLESSLDPRWSDARLSLRIDLDEALERAAALLAPASPGLSGSSIRFFVARSGSGIGPEAVRRLLRRIDAEGIGGELTLVSTSEAEPQPEVARPTLAAEWQASLEVLPADWSDLVVELELSSSVDVDRAAVLCAPLNPIQGTGRPGFRFRCARLRGYGTAVGMVTTCLRRLDDEEIGGHVRIARVLSDVHPVGTQGAVFVVGRRPA
ncbi:MAG TPA: hypothetical protein VE088_01280 [Gaiellaceae bacterium]|nr:hypothetical protein [Gaiellaceae bacterium]